MAYGGLPVAMIGSASASTLRQVKLDRESELRIEVANETPLRIRLLNGNAEIFGTELPPEIWLTFPPRLKFAVFTWCGATIELDGTTETDYTADETPMVSYVNVHVIWEGGETVPKHLFRRTLILLSNSGKSTLSRMLLSWAAKQGWKPTFVDLDIGQGSITVPGCIATTPFEMPIDPVEGIPLEIPLVYFFGHATPSNNVDLYRLLVKELAHTQEKQFTGNAESRAAVMVINTMGWIEGLGYELILHAIDALSANVVLVLGQVYHDAFHFDVLAMIFVDLYFDETSEIPFELHAGKSGVLSRDTKVRQKARSGRFFMSTEEHGIFNDLHVYRIGGGPQAPRSALPIGADLVANPLRLVAVTSDQVQELIHLVLAVSYAEEPD
ncbi:hypothetical protein JRO89_XS11G0158700 [Xanthoceras sorbifolium]|uniref:Protein CLP1 homolog n=1 Tax=Xanthoceras sorbifolium TaxID=99658 RepID=A0ABQ8HFP6_9ROSI|nr:hypothetical protein JRO89_XS11G0158700 [Xanthoceras sorbifolium]